MNKRGAMILELPLAVASFLFNRLMKNVMRAGLMLRDAGLALARKDQQWIVLSLDDMLARPGALPLIMTTAPRWNTHAILATLSPLDVRDNITVDVRSANLSAGAWTIVVCTYAGRRTVTSIGSHSGSCAGDQATLHLPPGKYWLGLRYYEWQADVQLPAVDVDGQRVTAGRSLAAGTNDFYQDLHQRSNLFYLSLHYYVFVLLRYPALFPETFIRRELLPMGNPETEFLWGALRRGEALHGQLSTQALPGWNVLLTVYNKASFPVHSQHVRTTEFRFVATMDCIYLLRVNRKTAGNAAFPGEWLQLRQQHVNDIHTAD